MSKNSLYYDKYTKEKLVLQIFLQKNNIYKEIMDISKIFQSFRSGSFGNEDNSIKYQVEENPIVLLGMFKKLIQNNMVFTKKIETHLGKSLRDIDKNQIKKAGEFVVYNRAWNYISKVNYKDEMYLDALRITSNKDLKKCLNLAIYFFEDLEEYEKCNHIKKILDKVELFLAENLEF